MSSQGVASSEHDAPPAAWPTLEVLACPSCHGDLEGTAGGELRCDVCERKWREVHGWLDFRPGETLDDGWRERQSSMEGWYGNLITASDQAESCWRHDYDPLAEVFAGLRGRVLDVGGGNGVVREYLDGSADLVVLDPSPAWLREDWLEIASAFPALLSSLTFVLGVGERLPFANASFDAILAIFSINHMARPVRFIDEAARVLRPGGRLLIVAEDVEPQWTDLLRPGYRSGWTPVRTALRQKLDAGVRGRPWPVHPEHLRITEGELREWLADRFALRRRSWVAGWLVLEADRRPGATG